MTPDWFESKWCFAEMIQAREKGKPIFPVTAKTCQLPDLLSDTQKIDLIADPEGGYRRLALGLRERGLEPTDVWDSERPPLWRGGRGHKKRNPLRNSPMRWGMCSRARHNLRSPGPRVLKALPVLPENSNEGALEPKGFEPDHQATVFNLKWQSASRAEHSILRHRLDRRGVRRVVQVLPTARSGGRRRTTNLRAVVTRIMVV
jgi:hypothetical protein